MAIDRRQQILEAATKSFTLFGYKATTMDQVAKLANVGKGTIYNFFTNKEQLFQFIVQELITEMKQTAERQFAKNPTFHGKANAALMAILEYRNKHRFMMKLIEEEKEMGTPAVVEMTKEIEEAIVSYIKGTVDEAVKKGEIDTFDSEVTAFLMYKMYISLISDWERNHKPLDKEEIAGIFQQLFVKG